MTKATGDDLDKLHSVIAKTLTERISDGSATAADISAAIKFLKDNGVEADISVSSTMQSLAHAFPSFEDTKNEERLN